jgi:mannitol/fructose-specific phosphotransferase system IIA component
MLEILSLDTIKMNAKAISKQDAIRQAGELLVKSGRVKEDYVKGMLAREETMSTYVGNGVSIPHGKFGDLELVKNTGISVLQLPEGVEWMDGEKAYLVIGIASKTEEHIKILQNLAEVVEDPATAEMLAHTTDPQVILDHLNRSPRPEDE